MKRNSLVRLLLLACMATVLGTVCVEAHHIRGIPHYSYKSNYPETPVYEVTEQEERWAVTFTYYTIPGQQALDLAIYIRDTSSNELFSGTVTFLVFGKHEDPEQSHSYIAYRNPTNIYNDAGSYTVILYVTGPDGTSTNETKTNYITVTSLPTKPPVAAFIASPTSGEVPLTVGFINQSGGQIDSYQWDLGDGNTKSERDPIHTYNTAGIYTVSLYVAGPGGIDTETKKDFILATSPPPIVTNQPPYEPKNPIP